MRPFLLAATLLCSPPAFADEMPGSQFSSGFWAGAAQTDAQGAFSYCEVDVGYTNGEVIWLVLYPDDTIWVLLSHPDVRFQSGQTFDIWMMMETGLPFRGIGEVWDEAFAGVRLQGIDETVAFLTGGQYLRMLGIGIDEAYDVTGIAEALSLAQNCLVQNGGNNPFGTKPAKTLPPPKVPDLKPKTGGALGTRPGGALGMPAPKPAAP